MVNGVEVDRTEFGSDPLNPVRTSDIRAMLGSLAVNVLDGQSDEEVLTCAREVVNAEPLRIAAGPAALAGALAECLGAGTQAPQPWPRLTECLVVNGSRHPSSAAQIEYARAHGVFGDGWSCFEEEVNGEGVDWARQTGQSIRRRLASSPVQALVVFGGDTAFGIHHALGAGTFESIGEIAPGVPLSRCGGMYWITKAGGFGAPDILGLIRDRLS